MKNETVGYVSKSHISQEAQSRQHPVYTNLSHSSSSKYIEILLLSDRT